MGFLLFYNGSCQWRMSVRECDCVCTNKLDMPRAAPYCWSGYVLATNVFVNLNR